MEMSRVKYRVPIWVKKKIENELYHYWDNQKELEELRNDVLEISSANADGQPKGNNISNTTEQKAIKLRTSRSILMVEKRLNYIEKAIKRLNEDEKEVFEIIFKERYNSKMAETYKNITSDTYYNVRRKIIYYTAIEFGEI